MSSLLTFGRGIFRPLQLESMFLFVTSTCNSLCRTCFYWDELNSNRDLSFEQLEAISATAPQFHKLWISGGEPFLRRDLAEIIELFYCNNGARHVNLPTNGLLPRKLDEVITFLLERCPELTIDLNFSLDGLANTHDTIRGVPHNFEKTLQTMEMAAGKWRGVRRLRRNVVTCITSENYAELVELAAEIARETESDGHYFEVIRGEPMDAALKRLTVADLKELHRHLMPFHEHYADKLFSPVPQPARTFAKAYYLGMVKFHFDLHEQNFTGPHKWPMPCTAGSTTVVIDHDGHFRACEMRSKLGRLQDFDFNLTAALSSEAMRDEVAAIPQANCWCTHSCWIYTSRKFSPSAMLFHVPWAYLKHRWSRLPAMNASELSPFRVKDAPLA